jgi:protein-S-isoprenylcysteine O-methyltransferase Ste14
LIAFIVLPGIGAFLLPLAIAAIDPWRINILWPGAIAMLTGGTFLLWCVRDFYVVGKGTLAPWDPPKKLVLIGLYRYVRNPMYVGVLMLVAGWTIYLASPLLVLYTIILAIGFHIRVVVNEEPFLNYRFGDEWLRYSSNVGRWLPRFKPWRGEP